VPLNSLVASIDSAEGTSKLIFDTCQWLPSFVSSAQWLLTRVNDWLLSCRLSSGFWHVSYKLRILPHFYLYFDTCQIQTPPTNLIQPFLWRVICQHLLRKIFLWVSLKMCFRFEAVVFHDQNECTCQSAHYLPN
jgi:hypothetical protein